MSPVGGRGIKILQELKALKEKEQAEEISSRLRNVHIDKSKKPNETTDNPLLSINALQRTNEGNPITTRINKLRLKFNRPGNPVIYQYHATFSPELDGRNNRCRLAKNILDNYVSVFDGTIAYICGKRLSQESYYCAQAKVEVTMQLVNELKEYPTFVLNNIMRSIMADLRFTLMRRNYFNLSESVRLPQHRLEVWPGFITSINYHYNSETKSREMLLTMDVSNRVLRTLTCLEMLNELYEASNDRSQERVKEQFEKTIFGCVVLTRYNNRTYRIDGIEWSKSVNDSFTLSDGCEISFKDYYERFHNLKITDSSQPLLLSRIRKVTRGNHPTKFTGRSDDGGSVLLIPEFCFMTGLTDALRSDFKAMKDLSAIVHLSPSRRIEKLKVFVENIRNCPQAQKRLDDWGLSFPDDNIVSVSARILPTERIMMGNNREISYDTNADWGKELSRNSVLNAVPINHWILICPQRISNLANFFEQTLKSEARNLGLSFGQANNITIPDDRTSTYIRSLKEHIGDGSSVQLVVVIFPSQRDDRYCAVKRLCCVEVPVASQVIIARSLSNAKKARTICQRIMLQINCKMGGSLWSVPIPVTGLMVCGIDVYHHGSGQEGRSSVGAIVCSSDRNCTKWYSKVTIQSTREELIQGLRMCFLSAIRNYHNVNMQLPNKIVIFRDGVGDGNFNVVKNYELDQLTKSFSAFSDTYCPQLSALVIHKRINDRIFDGNRDASNPHVGTVVDNSLLTRTNPDEEFFLVSQHVNQGTVNPTRFILIANTTKLNLDKLQRLAFKLTHMYYNWPGTVRVPAPCLYAHKLAYLIGQSVQMKPAEELSNRLYYL